MNDAYDNRYDVLATASNKRVKEILDERLSKGGIRAWGFAEQTTDRFSAYDGWVELNNGDRYLFETKNINYTHDKFPGWMLEVAKRNDVFEAVKELGYKGAMYINTFSDGKHAIWNMAGTMGHPVYSRNLPNYTATGANGSIAKDVVYLKWDERLKNKKKNG
jgi:hypothetical protein